MTVGSAPNVDGRPFGGIWTSADGITLDGRSADHVRRRHGPGTHPAGDGIITLGVGALIAPLRARIPRGVVLLVPLAAILAGLPIAFNETPPWTGVVLVAAFGLALTYLVRASRGHRFTAEDVERTAGHGRSLGRAALLTAGGIVVIAIGGELVAIGAEGLISTMGLSAGLVGMVITPVAIEAEEIIRQVIPARRGYGDVSAGNAIGTVLYFVLFNLGLIALLTPVAVPDAVRTLDWPIGVPELVRLARISDNPTVECVGGVG